jgi:acyl carrier protein
MRDRVRQVMADVFSLDAAEIAEDASIETVTGWDSLAHLELMMELEIVFGVQIPASVMPDLLSVEAIEDYLAELVGGRT